MHHIPGTDGFLRGQNTPAGRLLRNERSGVAIDFLTNTAVVRDWQTPANNYVGTPAGLLTYTSPSAKFILDRDGLLRSASTIRTEFDRSGNPLGVLIEEARTNLILRSQEMDNASWSMVAATVSVDATTAPDGTLTADKIEETSATNQRTILQSKTSQTTATFSAYVKAAERTAVSFRVYNATSDVVTHVFDLSNGTVSQTTTQGATFSSVSSTISALANGWYRITITTTRASGTTFYCINLNTTPTPTIDTGGAESYAGSTGSGLYVWGVQVEAGAYATSYIATTSATVTRAVDTLSISGSRFPAMLPENSIFWENQYVSTAISANCGINLGGSNPTNDRIQHRSGALLISSASVLQANLGAAGETLTTAVSKRSSSNVVNNFRHAWNGILATPDTAGDMPTNIANFNFYIDAAPTLSPFGWARRLVLLPRIVSDFELQSWTKI